VARVSGSSTFEGVLIDWSVDQPIEPSRLPVSLLSREQAVAELERRQRRQAMDAAYEAELILRLADESPDDADPPAGTPGARKPGWAAGRDVLGVSEFFASELALVLNRGRGTANHLHHRAVVWRDNLPATFGALSVGDLDLARAAALADVLGATTPALGQQVEDVLLPEAVDLSVAKVRTRALELLAELDAAAVDQRRREAKRNADVFLQPGSDGMATLGAELSADEAVEAYSQLDELAKMAKADGDERPIGQIRAELFSLLLRRPGGPGQPGVAAHLTVTVTVDSLARVSVRAGSVNGLAITAAHVRELLLRIGALGLTTPENGSLVVAISDAGGQLLATTTIGELLRLAKRVCPEHLDGDCECAVLGVPPDKEGYSPTGRQEVFVKTRDRTCRMPNCGQRVGWADLDHVIPHSCDGPTACTNLCCLCRTDHRLKTFARGWRFVMDPDGTLHVTTPSGVTRTTRPPGLRRPPPQPPSAGPPPPEPDDDPPPF
jgi:hypothetical protein